MPGASLFDMAKRKQDCPPEAASACWFPVDGPCLRPPTPGGRSPPHCPQPAMAGLVSHLRTGERRPFLLRSVKSARRSGLRQDAPLDRADGPHERPLRQEPPSPSRHPRDRDPRRARAQSQEHRRRDPARPAGGVHRAVGLGQILARLRHHLCRRPAPLCGVALRLCAAIPGDDAEAGPRPDRRALAGDLDRAEDHLAQPALDRRHGHRNLRLHAASVGAHRRALFARHRSADREPDGVADGRPGDGAAGGYAALSAGAGGARTQGRVPQGARRLYEARLPAREDRRQLLRDRRGARARQEIQPRHRRGGGPASWCGPTSRPAWRIRWRRR